MTSVSESLLIPTTLYSTEDHYRTGNAFCGGQIGLKGDWTCERWTFEMRGTVGLGANEEQIRAFGYSLYQTPLVRIVTPTGLTVQDDNTGTFDRTSLNMVAAASLNVTYRLTEHASLFGGYSYLLWDGPVRSGDQINPVVNTNPHAPLSVAFKEDVFWAKGVNVGVMCVW